MGFSSSHRRHLLAVLNHADAVLAEAAGYLQPTADGRLFDRPTPDATPQQCALIAERLAELRQNISAFLADWQVPVEATPLSGLHNFVVALDFASMTLEETNTRRMVGYGRLDSETATALDAFLNDLQSRLKALRNELMNESHAAPNAEVSSGLRIDLPDGRVLQLEHLVLDYNGTLAVDGKLLPGVREALAQLAPRLKLHVVTGDTFGQAAAELAGLPCQLSILPATGQTEAKRAYVERLGPAVTACIGNGRNDCAMLECAALGIAVVQREGAAGATLLAADVVMGNIVDALEMLLRPLRLCATLRG